MLWVVEDIERGIGKFALFIDHSQVEEITSWAGYCDTMTLRVTKHRMVNHPETLPLSYDRSWSVLGGKAEV